MLEQKFCGGFIEVQIVYISEGQDYDLKGPLHPKLSKSNS